MAVFLATVFVIVCVLLVIVVLLQKGRGGGLGGAFGGAGSSAFGTRTGDVFTWVTIVLVMVYLLMAIVNQLYFRPEPQRVPTPIFSPAPGAITEDQRVIIRCKLEKADIYYTTDGTEPTRESPKYDNVTVLVKPGETLKAKAFNRGWLESETGVAEYPRKQPKPTTAPAPTPASTPASRPAGGS